MSLLFEVVLLLVLIDRLDVRNHRCEATFLVKVYSHFRIVNFLTVYMPAVGIIAVATIRKRLIHTVYTQVYGCIKFFGREIQTKGIDKIRNLLIGDFPMKTIFNVALQLFNKFIPVRDFSFKSVAESDNAFIRLVRKRRVDEHELFGKGSIYFHSFFKPNDVSLLKENWIFHR